MSPRHEMVNPAALGAPRGYSHGVLAFPGRILFVAGQIGWDRAQKIVSPEFVAQFDRALENVLAVVKDASGTAEHICRMTIYVDDRTLYERGVKGVGFAYRKHMGKHFPAMTLVEVKALLEPGAHVEIEATAVIP